MNRLSYLFPAQLLTSALAVTACLMRVAPRFRAGREILLQTGRSRHGNERPELETARKKAVVVARN